MAKKSVRIKLALVSVVIAAVAFAAGSMVNGKDQSIDAKERARIIKEFKERLRREQARVEEVEARGYPKIFDPGPEDVPEAMFVTNMKDRWRVKDQTIVFPVRQYMYDYVNVLYSKEFAERYGYPTSHVAELSEGLHLIEFWMRTEQTTPSCRFHLLIDKSKELWLPPTRFNRITDVASIHFGVPMVLPARIKGFKESARDQEFRLANHGKITGGKENDFVLQGVFLSGQDHTPGSLGRSGSLLSITLETYSPNLYEGLNYLVVYPGCSDLSLSIIEQEKSQLWIATRAGRLAGRKSSNDPDDYYRVRIPSRMKSEIVPMMRSQIEAVGSEKRKILSRYYNSVEKKDQ